MLSKRLGEKRHILLTISYKRNTEISGRDYEFHKK